ncbi:hypothetical protein [Chondromyces crocatus]|uniref:CdiI C-terminal domain-containing protein n=1 Tax=Chondromyces crocatus TaxID=52 RepID=A0A0K1EDQ4_CHOCO|nr:hypothetical protein [Chondromyces crocatus]AKT38698.1 uncharacterized protein CMC5_028460 [Chondromyces crocatus]
MDFFDIYFLDDFYVAGMEGSYFGEICIGSFREKFALDSLFWSRDRYEEQWIGAARRIMTHDRALMMASICEPTGANFFRWWGFYRAGDLIAVQDQFCPLEELDRPFSLDRPEDSMQERHIISEGGRPISEWFTTVEAIRAFLERRTA